MSDTGLAPSPGWRVILDGPRPPAVNMALDEAIMSRVAIGAAPPTLRFYGWDRPAVSLGYHQVPAKVLDLDAVAARGLTVVTRPTGGRAVLHGEDLTYSVALRATGSWAASVTHSYRILSEALRNGFLHAGIDVDLARGSAGHLRPGPLPCFASTARYELVWNGKKLVGSAQRRMRGGLLQQGSIPLRRGTVTPEDLMPAGERRVSERWATAEEAAGRPLDSDELARCLAEGFCERLCVSFEVSPPDPCEVAEAEAAAAQ